MDGVLESHGPCESLEFSIVRIGLETTELRGENETQIAILSGAGRRRVGLVGLEADAACDRFGAFCVE